MHSSATETRNQLAHSIGVPLVVCPGLIRNNSRYDEKPSCVNSPEPPGACAWKWKRHARVAKPSRFLSWRLCTWHVAITKRAVLNAVRPIDGTGCGWYLCKHQRSHRRTEPRVFVWMSLNQFTSVGPNVGDPHRVSLTSAFTID